MSVVTAMPEAAQLPITAKYLNPNDPQDKQKFRLSLDPKRVKQEQLDEFRQVKPDEVERLFEEQRNTRSANAAALPEAVLQGLDISHIVAKLQEENKTYDNPTPTLPSVLASAQTPKSSAVTKDNSIKLDEGRG